MPDAQHTPEPITLDADDVAKTAFRVLQCYYALAGIADPAAFVARSKAIEEALRKIADTENPEHYGNARDALHKCRLDAEAALSLPGAPQ